MLSVNKLKIITSLKYFPLLVPEANKSCISSITSDKSSVSPTQAQVIICGAGAVANSVAYHLTENGWSDVLLIDKGRLVWFLINYSCIMTKN